MKRGIRGLGFGLAPLLLLTGCGVSGSIDNAISEIDETRKTIAAQSDAWRAALPKLVDQLNQLEGQVTADAKGVIADTSTEVQALVDDSIKFANVNAQEIIAKTGVEFRCNTDFAASGITARLQYLIDDLKFWQKNKHHNDQKPRHAICQIIEDTLPLYPVANNQFGIDSTKLLAANQVAIFGYNFRGDAMPRLQLMDGNGNLVRAVNVTPAYVTQYQLTLDFSTETFAGVVPGSRVQFLWPDQSEPNTITLSLSSPSKVQITGAVFNPSSPVAAKDAVWLSVTLFNQGDTRSGPLTVNWTPAGARIQSVSEPALNPKESRKVTFPSPFTYPEVGTASNYIALSNGDDAKTIPIAVQTNVASVQNYPIAQPKANVPWYGTGIFVLPGDRVEIVDAGGCVNTGGKGATTKRYVDPLNKSCKPDSKYYGRIAIPGTIEETQGKSIKDFWQTQKFVIVNRGAQIELGYLDDSYGDNGYWGMGDRGTCDQCRGAGNAHVTIRVTHYK